MATHDIIDNRKEILVDHINLILSSKEFFQKVLTSSQIKLKQKSANIAGLQVADLLAYPVKQEILLEQNRISDPGDVFSKEIGKVIASKYNCQMYDGRVHGYGKVFLA